MKLKFMVVCQSAAIYPNGTFSLLNGGVSELHLPSFPATIALTVFIHAEALPHETGSHRYSFSLRDAEGRLAEVKTPEGKQVPQLFDTNLTLDLKPGHPKGKSIPVAVAPNLPFSFEKPGQYIIRCEIDGQTMETPMEVTEINGA